MSNVFYHLLPIYVDNIASTKTHSQVISLLKQNISPANTDSHPYKGTLVNDRLKFSKRDISLNVKSELVFTGTLIKTEEQIILKLKGRYKIIPMLGYLAFIALFSIPAWTIDNPLKIILPLLPYSVMVVKIKIRAKEIFNDFRIFLN